jgi:hypothetical protein
LATRKALVAAGELQRGLQHPEAPPAESWRGAAAAAIGRQQAPQRAKLADQLPTQVHRALATATGAEQHRQQLGIGQPTGPMRQQFFTGPLLRWPVADRHFMHLQGKCEPALTGFG